MNFKSYTVHEIDELCRTGIYAIVNLVNGKFYIGSAATNTDESVKKQGFYYRWTAHVNRLKAGNHKNCHLQRAWNKYGASSFKFQILEFVEPERCIEVEQVYLDLFPEGDRDLVYNICFIAGSVLGRVPSEESRRKCAESNAGNFYIVSPEGEEVNGRNLTVFCKEKGLERSGIIQVMQGGILHYNGWTSSVETSKIYRDYFDKRGIYKHGNSHRVEWVNSGVRTSKTFKDYNEAKLFRNALEESGQHKFQIHVKGWRNILENAKKNK